MGKSNSSLQKKNNREDFICVAGIGDCGSKSKSSQTIINNTVNKNYMDTLNKTIMNSAVETIINNANSCSSAVNVNNSCNVYAAP